ncbi:MAG TPA: PucR family transcriptional regulator ligand-binding domain-containing protein [Longimicrobiaceae bacterium]|nr:PucR family transcriptional regulator ligand-binding domain-containing protein [Longimicrobiaceae bacterium]
MTLTVGEFLDLSVVASAQPEVLTGHSSLSNPISWVHISELVDVGDLLAGGELVLTTGIAFPNNEQAQRNIVSRLISASASALVIELGRRYTTTPPSALVDEARREDLPLIVFHRQTPFVNITRAVHKLIVSSSVEQLEAANNAYRSLVQMLLDDERPSSVLKKASEIAGAPVVLESFDHKPMLFEITGSESQGILSRWEIRSKTARMTKSPEYIDTLGWLIASVGPMKSPWFRIVLLLNQPPTPLQYEIIDAASSALTILHKTNRAGYLTGESDTSVVRAILQVPGPPGPDVLGAMRARGFKISGSASLGLVITWPVTKPVSDEWRSKLRRECLKYCGKSDSAMVGSFLDDRSFAMLISRRRKMVPNAVATSIYRQLSGACGSDLRVCYGNTVEAPEAWHDSMTDARLVADVSEVRPYPSGPIGLRDLGVDGLLAALADSSVLRQFVELQLAPLDSLPDSGRRARRLLLAYFEAGGSKSRVGEILHMSRSAVYRDFEGLGEELNRAIAEPHTATALYLALLAERAAAI